MKAPAGKAKPYSLQHFHPKITFSGRRPHSTRSSISSSRRVLGAHASEGGGMSPVLPDAEQDDFGESQAISSGGEQIGSTKAQRGQLTARRQEGENRKARKWVALMGRALPLLKRLGRACNSNPEESTEFESIFQKLPESYSARIVPPNGNFLPVAV